MFRSVIYALIAIVVILIIVDLLGRRGARRPRRVARHKSRSADETPFTGWGGKANARSDFPATTFSEEDAKSAAGLASKAGPAPVPVPGNGLRSRPALNTLGAPVPGAAHVGAAVQPLMRPGHDPLEKAPRKRLTPSPGAVNSVRLYCRSGPDQGQSFPIVAAGTFVGRHPSCRIVIADRRVSGRHAWLGIVLGRVMLRDLDSTNGTLLNGHPNRVVGEVELHDGDTIRFGGHKGEEFELQVD